MDGGWEWIVDARGADAQRLADLGAMRALCDLLVLRLGLRVVGEPQWHQFPGPAGVTGLYLLSESHLALHTFPETGVVTINVYSCRGRGAAERLGVAAALRALVSEGSGARDVRIAEYERGGGDDDGNGGGSRP